MDEDSYLDTYWESVAEQQAGYFDNDPSPYEGTYSEE